MKRVSLYSSSGRSRDPKYASPASPPSDDVMASPPRAPDLSTKDSVHAAPPEGKSRARRHFYQRYQTPLLLAVGALIALGLLLTYGAMAPPRQLSQEDIDNAVLHSLQTQTLPSSAARAYEVIRPSVVRVRGMGAGASPEDDVQTSVGTGVMIVESGMILTSLHVVDGALRLAVTFADGFESEARVVGVRPEHDLAVLRATTLPDDAVPATLRSTHDLALGDEVIAVGFPFGIGPSVSAGVVSGLQREYYSMEGRAKLSNLIQFDAAANPGSSGGPLVTADGEVVGIVTSILNPTNESFFVGIGFAVPIENAASAVGTPPF